MKLHLEPTELLGLINMVFAPKDGERWLCILVDLPDDSKSDNKRWYERRNLAESWFSILASSGDLPFSAVKLVTYSHVGSNNADLPTSVKVTAHPTDIGLNHSFDMPLETMLRNSSVLLAMTEFSATAPLKNLARQFHFRAATLPGFQIEMIPALGLNYEKIHERVLEFKKRMDSALSARIQLRAHDRDYECTFDLRFRTGHASSGLMRSPGEVGNLPSGEAYIVPYEGEREGEISRTEGHLPVQFDDEVVVYEIERNRATRVLTDGPISRQERRHLEKEPAYGNIAELGIGVLGRWGIRPVGSVLLDEKLGPHIAFGRSDHFGGVTGPSAFRNPQNVIHIDRVYTQFTQPLVTVQELFFLIGERREVIMRNNEFIV